MKRIVQCPKCETKLSVFDLGKPISQKCPKCANTFEVAADGTVGAPEKAEAPSPETAAESAGDEKPVSVPAAQKAPAPVVSAPEPVIVESGISFLHVLVIFALLFVVIVVQVVTFKQTQAHLNRLEKQVYELALQVQKLKVNQ